MDKCIRCDGLLEKGFMRRALGALSQARQRAIAGAAASAHPKEPHAP